MKTRLGAIMLAVLAVALPAAAQEEGDPVVGQELATQLCTACHIVGTEQVGSDAAPPFPVIAKDPDMTLTQLHGWLGPAHPVLRNLALTPEQIADINAYLDALHEAPAEKEPPRVETEEPPPGARAVAARRDRRADHAVRLTDTAARDSSRSDCRELPSLLPAMPPLGIWAEALGSCNWLVSAAGSSPQQQFGSSRPKATVC